MRECKTRSSKGRGALRLVVCGCALARDVEPAYLGSVQLRNAPTGFGVDRVRG